MVKGMPTSANTNTTAMLKEDWGACRSAALRSRPLSCLASSRAHPHPPRTLPHPFLPAAAPGFKGYITADSDSCADIHASKPKGHAYVATGEEAAALCLKGGTDIDSGNTYVDYLASGVNKSLITKALYQSALRNTYRMRFEMGLFDPNVPNEFDSIALSEVGSAKNVEMSALAADKSMVLLKNERATLPFATGKTVAVVGTSAESSGDITGNYVGPLCPKGGTGCVETISAAVARLNVGGKTTGCEGVEDPSCMESVTAADFVVVVVSNAKVRLPDLLLAFTA
jgi:beta-glucosidase-like glycosyl hydrolase